MPTVPEEAVAIQRRYYLETAAKYEQMHAHEGDDNAFNRKFIEAMLQMLKTQSVLDVGTATGYRLPDLRSALPNAFLCGVEPVDALLGVARRNGVLSSGALIRGIDLAPPSPTKVLTSFACSRFCITCSSRMSW